MRIIAPIIAAVMLVACSGGGAADRTPVEDTTGTAARRDSLRRLAIADSLRDGYHVYKSADGRPLIEGELVGGQRHGVWTSYHPNGRMQSRNTYDRGVLNGATTVFHPNGVLYYTGDHRKGKPVGEWRFYDAEGQVARTVVYDTSGTMVRGKTP